MENENNVEFDEGHTKIMQLQKPVKSIFVDWLVKHKWAKSDTEAKFLLIALSLFFLSLAIIVIYFGSLYVSPTSDSSTTVSSPYTNNP